MCVEKPVPKFEVGELRPDNARKSLAQDSALVRRLAHAPCKEVDVVWVVVDLLK